MAFDTYRNRIAGCFENYIKWRLILDVGCGDGTLWIKNFFSRKGDHVVGIDIQLHKEWHNGKNNVDFIICDARYLPFLGKCFDTVFEKDMLHHADEYSKALDEMIRCSKKVVILVEANRLNPISYIHMVKLRKHNHFTQAKFRKMVLRRCKHAKFAFKEAHYFPLRTNFAVRILRQIEDLLEKILPRNHLSYNIAVIML